MPGISHVVTATLIAGARHRAGAYHAGLHSDGGRDTRRIPRPGTTPVASAANVGDFEKTRRCSIASDSPEILAARCTPQSPMDPLRRHLRAHPRILSEAVAELQHLRGRCQ